MKLRKLFALLMTLVMLLGMMPVSHAEVIQCDHDWAWRWPNGQPANCQEWKWSEVYCTKCGTGDGGYDQNGPCQPGTMQWVRPQGSNCQEYGTWVITCKFCGERMQSGEEPGPHNWTTRTLREPGCDSPGYKEIICSICGDEQGNPQEIAPLGHDWGSWSWAHGSAPTCTEGAWQVRSCKRCGLAEDKWVEAGNHQWGNWNTVSAGNCQTPAKEQRSCSVCGLTENRDGGYGNHAWGEWYRNGIPTCMQTGVMRRTCSVCGHAETDPIPTVPHNFGEWYVVTEPQVGVPGLEQRDCTFGCGTCEQREIPALEQDFGNDEIVSAAGLNLTLTLSSTPANGTHFVVGEEVVFTENWANNTDKTLYPFSVSIFNCVAPAFGSEIDQICSWFAEDGGGPVAPGATGSHTLTVTVTEADVARGAIYAMAELLSTVHNGPDMENVSTPFVTAPCGEGTLSADGLQLSLSLSSTPANGTHFVAGEEVVFTENWANNTDKTLYPFTVSIWTCGTPVFGSAVDQICSWFAEDGGGPVAPGATGSHTLTVTVTEADVARGAIYAMAELLSTVHNGPDLENVSTPFVTAPCGEGKLVNSDGVHLEKFIRNAPANGEYYVPGEVLNYALTLILDEGLLLDDAAIYDPIIDNDGLVISYGKGLYGGMGMDVFYTVTEEDAQRGYVENTAYATWIYSDSGEAGYCESETVIAPCGLDDSGDFGLTASLSVTKAVTSTPANGSYYVPGEVIFFEIIAANTSDETLTYLTINDPLNSGAPSGSVPVFAPGEAAYFQVFYPVTDLDAFAGSVSNIAFAEAVAANGDPVMEYSNAVTVPCGYPEGDQPFGVYSDMSVTKSVESLPLNGGYYTEGEMVAYKITYTNIGETVLTDVMIYDALSGLSEVAYAEKLEPGESRSCHFSYTVTENDVAAGQIINVAVGQYTVSGHTHSVDSNSVKVDTDGKEEFWVFVPIWTPLTPGTLPGMPGDPSDPGTPGTPYDPGTGWIDVIYPAPGTVVPGEGEPDANAPAASTPAFGIVDTDKLHGSRGENYCVRTITGRDQSSASYDVSFCAEHALAQSSALVMKQAAALPELQIQAASYAVALWRAEVEKLYQEILDASDAQARIVVMTEYVRFLSDLSNYENMLKALYPVQPAMVAQKVAEMWQDKCVTLCYEAHASASNREDSLLNVTASVGAAAQECTCIASAEESGKLSYTQTYCPVHGFPFGLLDALLMGQDTAQAWTAVRQIWNVELTKAYNQIADKLGDMGDMAQAEYATLVQWMMAREASLIALYPDHPELVVQTMVKLIMERVNDLCRVVK